MARGRHLDDQHRERIGRGVRRAGERKRKRQELVLSAVEDLERGIVRPELLPHHEAAEAEVLEIAEGLGLDDGQVTPMKAALLRRLARLTAVERGLYQLYLQTADSELASRLVTLAREARGILSALGLERYVREVDIGGGVIVDLGKAVE